MKATGTNRFYAENQWESWLDLLAADDYVVVDHFLPGRMYEAVQRYFQSLLDEHKFSKAAIGSSEKRRVVSTVRGDFIYWLDKQKDSRLTELFNLFDEVIENLRKHLFLSLSDYEFHFALYPPKTRYEKHIDQFREKKNRVISVLIYLNVNWEAKDGGELKIYQENDRDVLIEPIANRFVMFKSDTVVHEVMSTHTYRRSLTGWLLQKPAFVSNFF